MPVQQHVLNWLYSILTSEYHDVNRTYNDVAQALARYPSLSPRTDVHTFSSGASALLLHLSGTIPVNFRGSTYRFPLSIWVPHAYPREPPLLYVTPTDTMMVRPGQHVDPQGQVYHPYLANWPELWDKSTLYDFLFVLSDVFAKEPPVVARQQGRPMQSPQQPTQSPPPVPPLPAQMTSSSPAPTRGQQPTPSQSQPPPPPPKPQSSASSTDRPPPLPSKGDQSATQPASRYDRPPPLPHQGPQGQHHTAPMPPQQQPGYSPAPGHHQAQAPTQYSQHQQYPHAPPHAQPQGQLAAPQAGQPPAWSQVPHHTQPRHPSMHQQPQQQPGPAQVPAQPPPPPDLMDEDLKLNMASASAVAAPPIPPNPEKDALLRQLAQTLASIRQQSRQQNESSLAGLQAQRSAMFSALPTIQAEMGQLTQLSNLLTSNANILHEALRKADGVIEGSKSHPAPDIDELLVAPTVVSNQLYSLVAEERAIGDAIFMLGRAVERGRIPPAVFAKMTRSLAREWYMKKALVRKIGQGMGLQS